MRALLPTAALMLALGLGAAACSSSDDGCSNDADCGTGRRCDSGVCVGLSTVCGATNPCPSGQSCCGGACSETACCAVDQDCVDGWCDDGSCTPGARPRCSGGVPCEDGSCLSIIGQCVECLSGDECPEGRVCTLAYQCELPGSCRPEACAAQGQICDPESGNCRPCISRIECGDRACIAGSCQTCSAPEDCGTSRTCVSGRCVNAPGAPCETTTQCTDGLVCAPDNTCDACQLDSECPSDGDCIDGRCIVPNGECGFDQECDPPNTICSGGTCELGCASTGCPLSGQTCDPVSGRCVAEGEGILGSTCRTHDECSSGTCWSVSLGPDSIEAVCSQACVRTQDCPASFVCASLGDADICLPTRLLSASASYDRPPGASCSDGFVSSTCKSGFCDPQNGRCMETCALDQDCSEIDDSFICVYRNAVGLDLSGDGDLETEELFGFAALCQPPILLGRQPGFECLDPGQTAIDHDTCANGFCVQTPNFSATPRCARGCCTPADCTTDQPICKPIDLWDGVRDELSEPYGFQRSCLIPEYSGTKSAGEMCDDDSECASEICARGASGVSRCSHTCCRPSDCADYEWSSGCRTPLSNGSSTVDDGIADSSFDQLRRALGRRLVTVGIQDQASGLTTMCIPR